MAEDSTLKEFIRETLLDISKAINEVNATGVAVVNPINRFFPDGNCPEKTVAQNEAYISYVDFKISIGMTDESKAGGGVKIRVLDAGLDTRSTSERGSVVSFTLPVVFPYGRVPRKDSEKGPK